MARTIKFRAWTGKQMMYQGNQYLGSFIRRVVMQVMLDRAIDEPRDHESYLPQGTAIDDYLLQYTGIADNAEREIYEGDIVRFKDENRYDVGQVVYGKHNGAFCFYLPDKGIRVPMLNFMSTLSLAATYDFEVIGNVYENADMFQVAQ